MILIENMIFKVNVPPYGPMYTPSDAQLIQILAGLNKNGFVVMDSYCFQFCLCNSSA